jgi:hypothetical protein
MYDKTPLSRPGQQQALVVLTAIAAVATVVALGAVLLHVRDAWVPPLFFTTAIGNAMLFLTYVRHLRKTDFVPAKQKDHWIIFLFAGGPFGQLYYFQRFVRRGRRTPTEA